MFLTESPVFHTSNSLYERQITRQTVPGNLLFCWGLLTCPFEPLAPFWRDHVRIIAPVWRQHCALFNWVPIRVFGSPPAHCLLYTIRTSCRTSNEGYRATLTIGVLQGTAFEAESIQMQLIMHNGISLVVCRSMMLEIEPFE